MQRAVSMVCSLVLGLGACQGSAETTQVDASYDADGTVRDATARDDSAAGDMSTSIAVDAAIDAASPVDASEEKDTTRASDVGPDLVSSESAGCLDGAGIPEGAYEFTLEDRQRRFILRLPIGYSRDRAWPLVLALHGNGGSATYWDGTIGSRDIRGVLENDAILIIAEAIEGNWRDYDAPRDTWPARIESELLYFDRVIDLATSELCIDESAIFSMGFSGGGSFSGVLGCRRMDIRAIAAGGSVIYFDQANCVGTPAAWITIGTEELTESREAYRDFFRDRAGCDTTSMPTSPTPCIAYDACDPATPVHYCQHPDGHIWPDFGSQAMWEFFSQYVDGP